MAANANGVASLDRAPPDAMAANANGVASLLGIALISSGGLGGYTLFAWPPEPAPVARQSRPIYSQYSKRRLTRRHGASSSGSSSSSVSDSEQDADTYENPSPEGWDEHPQRMAARGSPATSGSIEAQHWLGFPISLLASLLIPAAHELCDRKFELVLDHLAFVGHPVALGHSRDRAKEKATSAATAVNSPDASGMSAGSTTVLSSPSSDGPNSPRPFRSINSVLASSGGQFSLGSPAMRPTAASPPSDDVSLPPARKTPSDVPLKLLDRFSVVLVIDTPPDKQLSPHLDIFYRDVVVKVTASLKAEERRSNYVSREAAKILELREKVDLSHTTLTAHLASLTTTSALCASLARLFETLKEGRTASFEAADATMSIIIHDVFEQTELLASRTNPALVEAAGQRKWRVAVGADSLIAPPQYHGAGASPFSSGTTAGDEAAGSAVLAPWQAILLLEDQKALMQEASDELVLQFLLEALPSISFDKYDTLLDTTPETVRRIVDHLLYWRKARIVGVVNRNNIYVVNPKLKAASIVQLTRRFAVQCPGLPPLPTLLAKLTPPRSFRTLIPSQQRQPYMDALVWMLRHDLVIQLHRYIRIVASPEVKRQSRLRAGSVDQHRGSSDEASLSAGGVGSVPSSFEGVGSATQSSSLPRHAPIAIKRTRARDVSSDALLEPPSPQGSLAESASSSRTGEEARRQRMSLEEMEAQDDAAPSVILEPGQPTAFERRWLAQIYSTRSADDVADLQEIVGYFNGRHHTDAILALSSKLTRRHLLHLLDIFAQDLVSFLAP